MSQAKDIYGRLHKVCCERVRDKEEANIHPQAHIHEKRAFLLDIHVVLSPSC